MVLVRAERGASFVVGVAYAGLSSNRDEMFARTRLEQQCSDSSQILHIRVVRRPSKSSQPP